MSKTREMINKDVATVKFAEHFSTKASIKNLLKQVPNAQKISVLFEDEKYGKELLGYGNMEEKLDVILTDVFKSYTAQVAAWRSTGDNRNTAARVSLFKNLIADRIEKKDSNDGISTGQQVVDNLADFLKTITGKEIETILTDAEVSDDEKDSLRMDIVLWVVVRTFINKEMRPVERIEGEVIETANASHKSVSAKEPDVSGTTSTEVVCIDDIVGSDDMKKSFIDEFVKLVETEKDTARIVGIIKPQLPSILKTFSEHVDQIIIDEVALKSDSIKSIIGDKCTLDMLKTLKGIDAVKLLMGFSTIDTTNTDVALISKVAFYTIIDVINNIDNDKIIAEGINLAKLYMDFTKGNGVGVLSSMIHHVNRIDDIITRNLTPKASPVVVVPNKDVKAPELNMFKSSASTTQQKNDNGLGFISEILGSMTLASGHGRLHPTCR